MTPAQTTPSEKTLSKSFSFGYFTETEILWDDDLLDSGSNAFKTNKENIEADLKNSEAFSRKQLGFKAHFEVLGFEKISEVRKRREIGTQTKVEIHVSGVAQVSDNQNLEDILVNAAERASEQSEIMSGNIVSIGLELGKPFEVIKFYITSKISKSLILIFWI